MMVTEAIILVYKQRQSFINSYKLEYSFGQIACSNLVVKYFIFKSFAFFNCTKNAKKLWYLSRKCNKTMNSSYVFPPLSLTRYNLCNRSISVLSLRRRHKISIQRLTYILIVFGTLLLRSYIQKWLASQQRNWKLWNKNFLR